MHIIYICGISEGKALTSHLTVQTDFESDFYQVCYRKRLPALEIRGLKQKMYVEVSVNGLLLWDLNEVG